LYIYKITNKINDKFYIGKSSKLVNESTDYFGSGLLIKKAIIKYGKENFVKDILVDNIQTELELNELEIEFIDKHKSEFGKKCYNLAEGGTGGNSIKFYSEEQYKKFVEKMKKVSNRSNQSGELNPNWNNKYDTGTLKEGYMFFKESSNWNNTQYLSLYDDKVKSGEFIPFSKGIKQSDEAKLQKSIDMKNWHLENEHPLKGLEREDSPNYGSHRTDEQKSNMKIALKKAHSIKVECKYCKKLTSRSNNARWHGDNCKLK